MSASKMAMTSANSQSGIYQNDFSSVKTCDPFPQLTLAVAV
jgi:hypothetical protein